MTTMVIQQVADRGVVRRIEAEVAEVAGIVNAAHGRLVELTAELIETEAWRGHGITSVEHWLVWHAGLSPHRARLIAQVARRRAELPVTGASLTRGELSLEQVTEVAKYVPARNDAEGASLARVATVPQLRNTLSRYRFTNPHDPDTDPEPGRDSGQEEPDQQHDDAIRSGSVAMGHDDDGRFRLRLDAPVDDGALIERALAEAKDALFHAGVPAVTWMDAFREVCTRSLSTVRSQGRRSRFRVYVHLDTDGGWLNQGPVLPPAVLAKLVCDGVVQPVWETSGSPVNVGRTQRIVPDRTRRLVLDRDRGCIVPGCRASWHLEVHHLLAWLSGGATDTTNLACLCPAHHDALHRGELSITGNADHPHTLTFTDATGRTMPPLIPPHPPDPDQRPGTPDPTTPRYRHPIGERIDNSCVSFTPAPTTTDTGRPHAPPT